ncbi:hypothetical protein [Aureimonas ureilytica]|uniref:hypothetical protein n=1 Tax=Aureimonas ureilytica TaxID=401562 RepID=UPI00037893B3|nr:hypothetical protein [Aureimonas ureilytica]
MLQADYEKLPNFVIPAHVSDASELVETSVGPVRVYHFDDGNIGLWWHFHGRLHDRMMPIIEGRSEWNTGAKAWHIPAENAAGIIGDIRAL